MNKVSILIPCYNGLRYIERCMNSILNQSYDLIEAIVVNDGSTDSSEEEILKFTERFKARGYKLKYKEKTNGGAASAIKVALSMIDTEYFMLLDIDDYLFPRGIEVLVKLLDSNKDYTAVRGNGYFVDESNLDKINGEFIKSYSEKKKEDIFEDLVYSRTYNWAGSYMVRTISYFEIIKSIGFVESKYGQNLQILLPISYKKKVGYVDYHVMKYIKNSNSFTNVNDFEKKMKFYEGIKKIRVDILNSLNANCKEYEGYLNVQCLRMKLALCYEYRKKEESRKVLKLIKGVNKLNKSDLILYLATQSYTINKIYNSVK